MARKKNFVYSFVLQISIGVWQVVWNIKLII
jgi:hypothetical protein